MNPAPKSEGRVNQTIPMLDLRAQYASIQGEVRAAVDEVLRSQQFVLGPHGERLEAEMTKYCGRRFALGVASGTDALILALRACGVARGNEVIVPAFTFIATAGAVSAIGARPIFADIRPDTFNIDPASVTASISARTRAIVAVHLYGGAADMDALAEIAARHNLLLIEDNAQALGATHDGHKLGSFGDASAISFYPSKNLGAYGDAGMVLTDSEETAARIGRLRNHGQSKPYVSTESGWNSRLDEIQAAVLCVKLRHLDRWIALRRAHAARYNENLKSIPGLRTTAPNEGHSFYLYTIRISSEGEVDPAFRRDRVVRKLEQSGISSAVFYPVPLHLQPLYASLGGKAGQLPVSERAAHEVLSLPLYPEMTNDQIDCVAEVVAGALEG